MSFFSDLISDLGLELSPFEFIGGLIVCVFAVLMGAFLAKKQARSFADLKQGGASVNFADYGDMRYLHLGTPWVQGSMKISKPFDIHLDYVQRMMAWMLFIDLSQIKSLRAMQLGLGAGALTKFCHHYLVMRTIAVELNAEVISTCKQWFNLPAEDDRLQIVLGDAAQVIQQNTWQQQIDVLQVDLYDHEAARPVLDSEDFYQDCRQLLTVNGCMVVNLYGRDSSYEKSLKNITHVFGDYCVWVFKPTKAGNTIVLAFLKPHKLDKTAMSVNAQKIENLWPLPATQWVKIFAPVQVS